MISTKSISKKKISKKKYIQPKAIVVPIKLGVWGGSGTTVSNTTRCLHPSSRISTPDKYKQVSRLKVKDTIWTLDKNGKKEARKIIKISKSQTSPTHYLIHIELSDGREVLVSPLHPLFDYLKQFRHLKKGNTLDGAKVIAVKHYYYPNQFTYDILPDGDTGCYWANGILMGSTLSKQISEKPIEIVERLISVVEFI